MRILIVGNDPVFAALLEDRLALSGHSAEVVSDGASAVRRAVEQSVDLAVVERELPVASGMEVLRALRSQPETRGLPVVMLSEEADRDQRVEALRAGADDFLAKPCDLEELSLRIDRLLGVRGGSDVALQGDLANHPLWEVIQYVAGADRSGFLVVRGPGGAGRLQVARGRVMAAVYRELEGSEALLALAGMKAGRFRFVTHDSAAGAAPAGAGLAVAEVLMEAAMLEDELNRRRPLLPATGAPLRAVGALPARAPEPFRQLPLAAVHRRIAEQPGTRLYDLLAEEALGAPLKVRLAVAWLVEQGALAPAEAAAGQRHPNTVEINSSVLLDAVVDELVAGARQSGQEAAVLPYLVLAAPGVWSDLQALFRTLPGWQHLPVLVTMLRQLETGSGASGTLAGTAGKISLHVKRLAEGAGSQAETVVPGCAGVVVWLDRPEALGVVERVVRRLEEKRQPAAGMLVAASPEARGAVQKIAAGTSRWRVIDLPPRSLLGLLRLMRQGGGA